MTGQKRKVATAFSIPTSKSLQKWKEKRYGPRRENFQPNLKATENTPLTTAQKGFVKLVAEGMAQGAAAHACGYKHPAQVANQLMKKPHVKKALAIAREEYAKASAMSKKKVMDGFLDAIAQAKTLADPSAQIQGWNSIAKMCGYFEPTKHKIEVDIKGKVIVEKLQTLSDDDLLKLAGGDGDVLEAEYVQEEDILSLPPPDPTASHDE